MAVSLPKTADVLVIGAGAIGSFAALHLARAGEQVIVLERKVPGVEASGANAGSLGAQNKPVRLSRLALTAIDAWQSFEHETGLPTGYHRTGGFKVAETEDGVERLRALAQAQGANGIPIEHLDGQEVRRRAPYVSTSVLAANFCPIDGHNDALIAAAVVARAAERAGARILCGTEATAIEREVDGTLVVRTSQGQIATRRLIVTAGIWSRDFLVKFGIHLPVFLRNNQMMVTEPTRKTLEHVIFHVDGHLTLKQVFPAASCLIGGGWPGTGDFRQHQKTTRIESTLGNADLAIRIVPALAPLRVYRSWSGFDWRTADEMPVIGEVPGWDGMFVCTSCFGGYTLSPILGEGLAEAVVNGALPVALEEFSAARALASAPDPALVQEQSR